MLESDPVVRAWKFDVAAENLWLFEKYYFNYLIKLFLIRQLIDKLIVLAMVTCLMFTIKSLSPLSVHTKDQLDTL